ncbi:FtsX-like permease family protein [Streptomyces palmae]|uniref:FtsX-like permease family protein n=1 Tax=Streptomyces palmae TaxID=1701085 RepID=A0A4Z0HAD7_9ACTN|nr:FtsX-like permease family protein [Streptomyces palmae]TGB11178.1 FtsX-like permease family protein [Streptomyces palmae]
MTFTLGYALRSLRARKAGFIGAFLAFFCASALVTACGALLETGLRGEIGTERYTGAPVVVSADQSVHHLKKKHGKTKDKAKPLGERVWLPSGTVARIDRVPGVRAAIPELTFPAALLGPDGRFLEGPDGSASLGHAWTSAPLTPFHLDRGHAPRTAREIVIDRGLAARSELAPGDRVTVQATGIPATYTVAGVAGTPSGELKRQAAIFFAPGEARRLAGHPGQTAVIGVLPEPGVSTGELAERVRTALDATPAKERVHTGGDRGPVEFLDAAKARIQLISMGGAIGGTGLLVAVLVVSGTFALSIQQRHRELALLRAVAATPRQVRGLIGREALCVGLLAGASGAAAGLPLGSWLHGKFIDLGAVPETLSMARSPFPPLAAVAATLLAAWAAARLSARRTARIRPAQAMAESAAEERRLPWARTAIGILALAGGVTLLFVLTVLHTEPASMPVTYLVVLLISIALALLGPLVARAALAVLGAPLRLSRTAGHLAAHNARANAKRLAAVITPLTLLVGMACTIVFVQTTLSDAAERQTQDGVVADWVIGSSGPGVPGAAADRLRRTPGVEAVTEVVHTTVRTPDLSKYTAQGVTPRGLAATMDLKVTDGSLAHLGDHGVAVSEVVADAEGLRPGSRMRLVLGDGTPKTAKVVAVYQRGLGFGDLTLPHDLVAAHIDNPLSDTVLVAGKSTASGTPALDQRRLATAIRAFPGTAIREAGALADHQRSAHQQNAEVSYVAMGLILAFTTIASVNTLAMSTADRRREFALLRLVGTTRRQVLRMLRLEALTVALTAVVLGTGISLAAITAFSVGMTGEASPSFSPGFYLTVVATAGLLATLATAIPARVTLRERPTETMRV